MTSAAERAYRLAELQKQASQTLQLGVVSAVHESKPLVKISLGDMETDWLPVPASYGRNFIAWSMMREKTAVVVAVPGRNYAIARIISIAYTADIVPEVSTEIDVIMFNDGTRIEYDSASSALSIESVGNIALKARQLTIDAEQLSINAKTTITGEVTQQGGDMTSEGVSVQHHIHKYDSPPKSTTEPEK